ncbi:MAG: tRNA (adenosine(37)-N6)-threonylcarbamoyltransferase complex transferase subunit TsaD [Myxococcota bacterium]
MRVLGIESSCDETGAAVVDGHGEVLADVVASQVKEHAPYGGVVPELASRAHMRNILPVLREACRAIDGGLGGVDAIAVTQGPGLSGALLVGLQAAKALAYARDLPLVGVDHLEGHLLSVFLRRGDTDPRPTFPYIALLASGGHTAIYRVDGPGTTSILGQTRDDAAGEAYDKVAKLLGLGYPGGPIVDRLAATGDPDAVPLPMPMAKRSSLEFSFSGLKTAVAQYLKKEFASDRPTEAQVANVCASFQRVAVETLARKSLEACRQTSIPRLVLTGGVAANRGLRARSRELAAGQEVEVFIPPIASCTDNAAMIAYAGALRLAGGARDGLDLRAYSRDPGFRRGKIRA